MGREIKRVSLDFSWPLDKVWEGYINPHRKSCPENQKTCFGGNTAAGEWLDTLIRLIVIAADDARLGRDSRSRGACWPHPYLVGLECAPTYSPPEGLSPDQRSEWLRDQYRNPDDYILPPTKELADLINGFLPKKGKQGSYSSGFGFVGSGAAWKIEKALLKAAKMPKTWGICPVCKGSGLDPACKEAYEKWKAEEPPEGPGWQLWETVSEGSPISPVFPTAEACIEWLVIKGYSKKAAESFLKNEWCPSMVMQDGKLYRDIESSALTAKRTS